jgi:hypothetical protein
MCDAGEGLKLILFDENPRAMLHVLPLYLALYTRDNATAINVTIKLCILIS